MVVLLLAVQPIRQFWIESTEHSLHTAISLLSSDYSEILERSPPDLTKLESKALETGQMLGVRLTIIAADGTVLTDTHAAADSFDNHSSRPEVLDALEKGRGTAVRYSSSLGENRVYAAQPLYRAGNDLVGILRLSAQLSLIQFPFRSTIFDLLEKIIMILPFAAIISLYLAYRISRPLTQMRQAAESFARGDLSARMRLPLSSEMASLAQTFNQMADQLNERISAMSSQRNQIDAVLSSMIEGVIALDMSENLLNINQAAAALLDLRIQDVLGKPLEEILPSKTVAAAVRRTLLSRDVEKVEVASHQIKGRIIDIYATSLVDSTENVIGALVVLNDITRLHRLESMRSDFVANVSHELRTPITSIQGFVETLLDGALEEPQNSRRFLEIVARQAERLNAIIEDLLLLSRLEQDPEKLQIKVQPEKLIIPLQAAVELSQIQAVKKDITIRVSCPTELVLQINAPLIEQAILNLIDNAIKYSEAGSMVEVSTETDASKVVIKVQDHGSGIDPEHLPRLFERFYRVDKARSRELGGTGLGLALVKHIAQVHKGEVSVSSIPGCGSTFALVLPLDLSST